MIKTKDNTFTMYSEKYDECYHSVNDGALNETLNKHIYPALDILRDKEEIKILDICFGLGYNTFATIINTNKKLTIYSPELDTKLVKYLKDFDYPKEFESIKNIIISVSENGEYEDNRVKVKILFGDAREKIKQITEKIDVVYQDAFSYKKNPELWTIEYFEYIKNLLSEDGIITTYSVATPIRYALYKLGFNLYTHNNENIRSGTIASKKKLNLKEVNFEEKLKRVKNPYYLTDKEIL